MSSSELCSITCRCVYTCAESLSQAILNMHGHLFCPQAVWLSAEDARVGSFDFRFFLTGVRLNLKKINYYCPMLILFLRIHYNLVTVIILMIQDLKDLPGLRSVSSSIFSQLPSVGRTTLKPSEPHFYHLLLPHTHNKANCGLHHSKTAVVYGWRGGARERGGFGKAQGADYTVHISPRGGRKNGRGRAGVGCSWREGGGCWGKGSWLFQHRGQRSEVVALRLVL